MENYHFSSAKISKGVREVYSFVKIVLALFVKYKNCLITLESISRDTLSFFETIGLHFTLSPYLNIALVELSLLQFGILVFCDITCVFVSARSIDFHARIQSALNWFTLPSNK